MKKYSICIGCLCAITLNTLCAACVEYESQQRVLPVIEGWIDTDGYPVLQFTSSIVPTQDEISLSDKMIQWGNITISNGDTSVIMTGGPSSKLFPPYRYYTYAFTGEPGHSYEITAEYESFKAHAVCTMPYPTNIKSIEFEPIEGNDSLRSATMTFIAPEDCPAYYGVTIQKAERGERPYPAMLSTVAALTPGEEIRLPVLNPKNKLSGLDTDFVPQLKVGQEVVITLCRLTPEVYNFWSEYDNVTLFEGSQFVNVESLQGNIEGGYGIWSARGTTSKYIRVM